MKITIETDDGKRYESVTDKEELRQDECKECALHTNCKDDTIFDYLCTYCDGNFHWREVPQEPMETPK